MENQKLLAQQGEKIRLEISNVTQLLSLCGERGITACFTQMDVDTVTLPFLTEPTELGFIVVQSRLTAMHQHLHGLLYAPSRHG